MWKALWVVSALALSNIALAFGTIDRIETRNAKGAWKKVDATTEAAAARKHGVVGRW